MAHNRSYKPEDIRFPDQVITESNLVDEMEKSYIEYAMSVIVGRALPDVRDGLKPVHRRILYTMYEDGLTSDKKYKKSATTVGAVLGSYHPHGDAAVYETMVRLTRGYEALLHPFIDSKGAFGKQYSSNMAPSASRYTEVRLEKFATELFVGIDKNAETVFEVDDSHRAVGDNNTVSGSEALCHPACEVEALLDQYLRIGTGLLSFLHLLHDEFAVSVSAFCHFFVEVLQIISGIAHLEAECLLDLVLAEGVCICALLCVSAAGITARVLLCGRRAVDPAFAA